MLVDKNLASFSFLTLGRIISSSSSAIFFIVLATLLEPEEYGWVGYLIALAGMSSVVSRFGLPQSVVVYKAKGEKIVANQINLLAIITTSTASIILIFINEFSAFLCLGLSFFVLFQHNLVGAKKYKGFLKNSIIRNSLAYTIPFPLYFAFDIPGILIGMAVGNIIGGIGVIKLIKFTQKPFDRLKKIYSVLINNFGISASIDLVRSVDRVLIATVFGFGFTGVYIFIIQILMGLELLPRVLYLFLLSEESSGKKHGKINKLVVLSSGLLTILVIFASPTLIEAIFPNYTEGIMGLQILALSLIPTSISLILSAKMQAKESNKVGYSAIVRIGSLLFLIWTLGSGYGIIGVSVAVVVSTILNTLILYFLYKTISQEDNIAR